MKRNIFHLLALLAGLLLYSSAYGQTRTIEGTVTDDKKQPISFASVIIKGTTKGTTTAQNGSFKLEAATDAILIIRAVGYTTKELSATGNHLDITLSENASDLNEVVVTALGLKKEKRNLTFSAQEVKSDEILRAKEPNVLNTLTGKVAGVQVTSSSGMPGSSARIVIRGITSISGENQALIVMDGVPINNDESGGTYNGGSGTNRLADIDPSTIENINVLKGAAATALYGSAGARGVVLITTKKGAVNRKPTVSVSSGLSFERTIFPDRQYLYAQGDKGRYIDGETGKSSTSWGPRIDTLTVNGQKVQAHHPLEEFFRTGITSNSTASVSGGSNASNYFMSYAYFDQKGTIPKTSYKRHSVFAKFNTQIADNLNATFQLTYSTAKNEKVPEGYGLESPLWTVFTAPVSYDLKPYLNPDGTQRLYRYSRNNPYWVLDNVLNTTTVNRFLPVITFVYTPFEWLSVTERAGADIYTDQQSYHVNMKDITYVNGLTYSNNKNFRQFNHDFIIQLKRQFGEKVNASLLLGNNVYSEHGDFMTALGLGLAKEGYYNMASASAVTYTESQYLRRKTGFYAQAEIDYNRMLVLSLTGRYDGSSVLSRENTYYPYGSVAGGFIFSELFRDKLKQVIGFGKIRASFASVGNDNVKTYATTTPYNQAVIYGDVSSNLTFPYNGQNGFLISASVGNPNLRNELQKEYELGLEMKLLDNRIGLEASYFNRKMSQGIVENISLANSTGYSSTTINSAKMSTNGIEVLLSLTPVRTRQFSWDVTINYTKLNQRVDYIGGGLTQTSIGTIYAKEGAPWGLIYGTKYARTADGQLRINDAGLPYASGEFDVVGNITPDWLGGITNQLRYKNFGLSFFFDTKRGGDILNSDDGYGLYYGSSKATEKRDDRVVPGISDIDNAPNKKSVTGQAYFQQISGITEAFIQDASYIKLRNVSLSYSLNKSAMKRLPFKDASIVLTGRNLWIHKDAGFSGSDPEVNSWGAGNAGLGVYTFSAPTARSYDCTLKFTFQ